MTTHLQCKIKGKCLIGFRHVVIFHGNEDGLTGFGGQQEGCSVDGFKVPCVYSL